MDTIILTDSCSDLTPEFVSENSEHLRIIGMPISVSGEDFIDDFGLTFSHDKLYENLRKRVMPTTSQITQFRFEEIFSEVHSLGKKLIYVGFSSGMSATFSSSLMAKESFMENNPDASIHLIDTKSASVGLNLLVRTSLKMLKEGQSYEAIIDYVESSIPKVQHWFAVDDLQFLKKGGRISASTAIIGSTLNVKPILTVGSDGKLTKNATARGRKKAMKELLGKFSLLEGSKDNLVVIGHGDCYDDALTMKEEIKSFVPEENVIISQLSATIASHVGPDMLAIAFIGKNR